MSIYVLIVVNEVGSAPAETVRCGAATEVLSIIPQLLERHPGCHRIHVRLGDLPLFSVDCTGETVSE